MSEVLVDDEQVRVGLDFVRALAALDFERLQACFHSNTKFRAMVPATVHEGSTAIEAISWLREWFGDTNELSILSSSVDRFVGQIHIAYRIRGREKLVWYLVEQQAYCVVKDGNISAMNLLCSGFRLDPN